MKFNSGCFGFQSSWVPPDVGNNYYCDVSQLRYPYCFKTKALCVKTIRETITRRNYSRWRCPGKLKVKISKIFFLIQTLYFEGNCQANVFVGLRLFISCSGVEVRLKLTLSPFTMYMYS